MNPTETAALNLFWNVNIFLISFKYRSKYESSYGKISSPVPGDLLGHPISCNSPACYSIARLVYPAATFQLPRGDVSAHFSAHVL